MTGASQPSRLSAAPTARKSARDTYQPNKANPASKTTVFQNVFIASGDPPSES